MEYTTYWSVLESPAYTIKSGYVFLILTIVGAILCVLVKKYKKSDVGGEKLTFLWVTGGTSVFGLLMFILGMFGNPDKAAINMEKKLDANEFNIASGVVSNFNRRVRHARGGSETIESFTVDSAHFAYGNGLSGGFGNFSETNNRIIYNGKEVRVTYRDGSFYGDHFKTILKLEIKE